MITDRNFELHISGELPAETDDAANEIYRKAFAAFEEVIERGGGSVHPHTVQAPLIDQQ